MYPYPNYWCSWCSGAGCGQCRRHLIRINPIDPSALNSLTTTAKSTSSIPGVSGATIAQAWQFLTLTNDLGQPPMTAIGDAIVVVVGSQPWIILRFLTTIQTVSATGIIQALSYANYFQNQIEMA
jgi:hypothetical protein